jgi:DNA-binding transcriptional LysR family regulator
METIDLNAVQLLLSVAQARSFTQAARMLQTSKQRISQRVAKLEKQLGVRLLERTTRSLRNTAAADGFLEKAATAFGLLDEAVAELQQTQRHATGLLRVSAPLLYGRHFLAPLVAAFRLENPKVTVELMLADRHVDLVAEGIDVAIRVGTLSDSSLNARKLGTASVVLVASPQYLSAFGVPRSAESLAEHQAIVTQTSEKWNIGNITVRPKTAMVVNHLETALACALESVGVARLPAFLTQPYEEQKKLVRLLGGTAVRTGPIHILTTSRTSQPLKVRRFVELLVLRAPRLG